jgi:hypothetical protein
LVDKTPDTLNFADWLLENLRAAQRHSLNLGQTCAARTHANSPRPALTGREHASS